MGIGFQKRDQNLNLGGRRVGHRRGGEGGGGWREGVSCEQWNFVSCLFLCVCVFVFFLLLLFYYDFK